MNVNKRIDSIDSSRSKNDKRFERLRINKDIHYCSIIQSLIENDWDICDELSAHIEDMKKANIKFHKMMIKNTMSIFEPTIDSEDIKLGNYNLKIQDMLNKHENYLNHLDLRIFIKLDKITKKLGITNNKSSNQILKLKKIMDKDD